ncbi:recombinase family protein [Nocardioides sp. L-11A]|uniref:recombinase family protein n=1 Tax=Nocardioides sp. L-11A TaxID=3043848 RepID=UPI00249AF6FF|nr:recombinase family protein [Nocardioides sp. L-11A]
MADRGYARISLDTKVSGSIQKQKSQITGSVMSKGGDPEKIEWYVDESRSGAIPMRERPDGGRLWEDVSKGDVVYVSKIDRAARSASDLLATVEHIEKAGASIVFVGNDIDTTGSTGRLLLTILAAVAEFERALIAERRRESISAAREEGRHIVGGAPYGFLSAENPKGRGLVIRPDWRDPEDGGEPPAKLLRDAIAAVMAGESQDSARKALGLSKTGMHKLLRNPRLAGMIPNGDGVVMVGGVPKIDPDAALLTLVEWRRLRDYLDKPETKAWSKARGYGAALRCEVCGDRLYYAKSNRKPEYSTYVCRRVKHEPGDTSPTVVAVRADAHLEQAFLGNWSDEPEIVEVVVDDPTARTEAIALAQVRLEAAQIAFLGELSDDEEEGVLRDLRDAKRALREAEDMPVERTTTTAPTGRTYGEAWQAADDAERSHLLLSCLGPAVVRRGKGLAIEEKVIWPIS